MPKIMVHKAFGLLLTPTSGVQRFEKGVHDVSDEVAGHWYTGEHAEVLDEKPAPKATAPEPAAPAPVEPAADEADETKGEGAAEDGGGSDHEAGNDGADDEAEASKDGAPDFDAMTPEELRAYLKARDGRAPHPKTRPEKLLAAAKGSAGA